MSKSKKKKNKVKTREKRLVHKKRCGPKSILKKAGVEMTGEIHVMLRCLACGKVWGVKLFKDGGFPENYMDHPCGHKEDN